MTGYPQSSLLSSHSVAKGPPIACFCDKFTKIIPEVPERSPNDTEWDPLNTNLKPHREEATVLLKTVNRTYYYTVKCPWGMGDALRTLWAWARAEVSILHAWKQTTSCGTCLHLLSPKKEGEPLQRHWGELANAYNLARQEVCWGSPLTSMLKTAPMVKASKVDKWKEISPLPCACEKMSFCSLSHTHLCVCTHTGPCRRDLRVEKKGLCLTPKMKVTHWICCSDFLGLKEIEGKKQCSVRTLSAAGAHTGQHMTCCEC